MVRGQVSRQLQGRSYKWQRLVIAVRAPVLNGAVVGSMIVRSHDVRVVSTVLRTSTAVAVFVAPELLSSCSLGTWFLEWGAEAAALARYIFGSRIKADLHRFVFIRVHSWFISRPSCFRTA